jgi:ankyrin repeat protein
MLLKAGADPTGVQDYAAFHKSAYQIGLEPSWPINLAAEGGYPKVIQLLLAAGANVDAPEDEGQTALMLAADRGHMEVVQLLLRSGADKSYRAGPGEFAGTAEDVAYRAGHKEIAEFIRSYVPSRAAQPAH